MPKYRKRARRAARRAPQREPKRRLLVVCEGRVTEPQYIRGLERWARNATVEIEIPAEQGDPKRLVEIAKDHHARAVRRASREDDDFLRFDEVWCVCDVDDHPRLADARQMARDNGIELVVSNPCFELWLVLHFRDPPGPDTRHATRRLLRGFIPEYDKHVDFEVFAAGIDDATTRACRLDQHAEAASEPGRNPTTHMYRLTNSIRRTDP